MELAAGLPFAMNSGFIGRSNMERSFCGWDKTDKQDLQYKNKKNAHPSYPRLYHFT